MIVHTDEYCLRTVSQIAVMSGAVGLTSSAGHILRIAGLVEAINAPDTDISKGITTTVESYSRLTSQHLLIDYDRVSEEPDSQVHVRYRLGPCPDPHQELPMPKDTKYVTH